MADIKIENAPREYQKYLKIGDAKGNANNVIDNDGEARAAAEALCKDTPAANCNKFFEYIEKVDYSFRRLKDDLLAESYLKTVAEKDTKTRSEAAKQLKYFAKAFISPELRTKIAKALILLLEDKVEAVRSNAVSSLMEYLDADISKDIKNKLGSLLGEKLSDGKNEINIIRFNYFIPASSKSAIVLNKRFKNELESTLNIRQAETMLKIHTQLLDLARILNYPSIDNLSPREAIILTAKMVKLLIYGDKSGKKHPVFLGNKSVQRTIERTGQGTCYDHVVLFLHIFSFMKKININLTNLYAKDFSGRISGQGQEHTWIMLTEFKGTNKFNVTYLDPTWAGDDEKSLNAVDRSHFHIGGKVNLLSLFSDRNQAKRVGMRMADAYLDDNRNSKQPRVLNEIAYLYREIYNNRELATKYYLKAIENYNPAKENEEGFKDALLESLSYLGQIYFERYKHAEALAIFERLVREFTDDNGTPDILDKIATIHLRQHSYQKAIATYQKIISDYPNHSMADDAYLALSFVYTRYNITGNRSDDRIKACGLLGEAAKKYPHGNRIDDINKRIKSLRCSSY